jgi:REP element-mobilizing transposase RayT
MANTYTQIYIQIVFAVQGHYALIDKKHKEELHKYITGIIRKRGQKLLAINCMPNHTHIFIGMKPAISLSDLVRDIKSISTGFINKNDWMRINFNWQEGFGAFSYGHSQLTNVIQYIKNKEEHHRKKTFREEYLKFHEKFRIEYDDKYLFEWYD